VVGVVLSTGVFLLTGVILLTGVFLLTGVILLTGVFLLTGVILLTGLGVVLVLLTCLALTNSPSKDLVFGLAVEAFKVIVLILF